MKKLLVVFILVLLVFTSCLTVEIKEYKFEMTTPTSGKLTLKWVNIMSFIENPLKLDEEVARDYYDLIENYIKGQKFESEFSGVKVLSKKLFEENGQLCGELVLTFDSLSSVNLYRFDQNSPYMFMGKDIINEKYLESNGIKGPDYMPVVFWDKGLKELKLKTEVTLKSDSTYSLLDLHKEVNRNSK